MTSEYDILRQCQTCKAVEANGHQGHKPYLVPEGAYSLVRNNGTHRLALPDGSIDNYHSVSHTLLSRECAWRDFKDFGFFEYLVEKADANPDAAQSVVDHIRMILRIPYGSCPKPIAVVEKPAPEVELEEYLQDANEYSNLFCDSQANA